MTTLTLNVSDELLAALNSAGRERSLSESTVAVELLNQALLKRPAAENSAQRWVETWRGQLKGREEAAGDPRVQHLLAKHLR